MRGSGREEPAGNSEEGKAREVVADVVAEFPEDAPLRVLAR